MKYDSKVFLIYDSHEYEYTKDNSVFSFSDKSGYTYVLEPIKDGEEEVIKITVKETIPPVQMYFHLFEKEIEQHSFTKVINPNNSSEGHLLACSLTHDHGTGIDEVILNDREPIPHTYNDGEILEEATCTSPGKVKYTCTGCGYEKTEITEIKDHTVEKWTTVKESTCNTNGSESGSCTVCGKPISRELLLSDHDYIRTVTKAPTLYATGEYTDTCSVCEDTQEGTLECLDIKGSKWDILTIFPDSNGQMQNSYAYGVFLTDGRSMVIPVGYDKLYGMYHDSYDLDKENKILYFTIGDATVPYSITPTEEGFSFIQGDLAGTGTIYYKTPAKDFSLVYSSIDDSKHVVNFEMDGTSKPIFNADSYGEDLIKEDHTLDENGKCIYCGYTAELE